MLVLAALNFIVFATFAYDKFAAASGRWRISERTLRITAFFAPFGAMLAMVLCRHKTAKPGIYIPVTLFALGHAALIVYMLFFLKIRF